VRAFVAIPIADPARAAVVAYLERLRATIGGVAWTRLENLHLTLKFLGNVPADRVADLTARLQAVGLGARPFALQVGGVGAFPSLARPRALWVGVSSPALVPLADAVEAACVAAGCAAEERPLRPHVTLGRVRDTSRKRPPELGFLGADGGKEFGAAPVDAFVLFRSELRSDGARHTALATVPLVGRDGQIP
jgi:RNA 2',3'-cyclic 3'-phosphodiesterase